MAKTDALHEFMALTAAQYGDNTLIIPDENTKVKTDVIPVGVPVVDNAFGIGGIPRGRITEIYGKEASGKTTLCLHVIAEAQKIGLNAAFIDAEHAISFDRMRAIGVDTSKLVMTQPDNGEQALNLVDMMVRSGLFAVIVVDSVAALTPLAELEKDMGDSVMGVHAKLMSQAMRKLAGPVNKYNVAMMFINQTRSNIGGYGNPEVTTDGNALKFYASLRLKMQLVGQIKNPSGQRIGGKYKMTVLKNKLAVPYKEAQFELGEHGIDGDGYFIDELLEKGVIQKAGAFLKMGDETLGQGRRALVEKLRTDATLKERLVQALNKTT
jgi:recombination protein RecA